VVVNAGVVELLIVVWLAGDFDAATRLTLPAD
jgi:hypothetical protein